MAKKVIGGEISREQPSVIDLTKSLYVLDLRKAQAKADQRESSQPRMATAPPPPAPTLPLEQTQPAEAPAQRPVAEELRPETPPGDLEEKRDHVRPGEDESPAVTTRKSKSRSTTRFLRGPWSFGRIIRATLKAVIVVVGAVIFLSLNIDLPERLIGIYFVASIVYAIDSQRTFLVALIFLVMVAVWSALGQNVPAESYAIYAFYFLVIGLVSALRELIVHKPRQHPKSPK
jgi:hypothetical protein